MSWQDIKKAIDESASAFEDFKQANEERLEAISKGNESRAAELDEKVNKINDAITGFTKLRNEIQTEMEHQAERLEELEARRKTPGKTVAEQEKDEYKQTFFEWIRKGGQSADHESKMQTLSRKMIERKDVTIGSNPGGGFAVPEEIAREIERLERKFSPVRDLVKVVRAGTSDYKELVNIRGTTSGWVGESGTRSATGTSSLREIVPTFGELYAYPQASEWSLDDIFFDVEAWIAEETAQEFAFQEGEAVINGNGTSKPTGMLNTSPVATDDFASPLRAAAAYEYIDCPASPDAIQPDCLIDMVYTLNSDYRSNATWVMNSVTTGAVRKLKDSQNQYLWQPGLQAGEPDRLLGFAHRTWEQMPDVGTNAFPVALGDFRRGYVLADRVGLRITRDDVTNVGFVRFYIRRREGGIVLNNDSIKFLRTS